MKRIIILIFAFVSLKSNAQTLIGDALKLKADITLKGKKITAIQTDTAFVSDNSLPTSKAVKDYVAGRGGTGNGVAEVGTPNTIALYNNTGNKINSGVAGQGINVSSGVVSTDVAKLSTVTAIQSYSGKSTSLIITDDARGGVFNYYLGTDSVNNGIIFLDATGRKWKRQFSGDRKLNLQWFGAKSTTNDVDNDILPFLNAAQSYIKNHRGEFDFIYIPYDGSGLKKYNVSNTFYVNTDLRIAGDGITSFENPYQTLLSFPENTSGIIAKYLFGQNGFRFELTNIQITGNWRVYTIADVTKHGYNGNVVCVFKNVNFTYFSGDGIHLEACGTPNTGVQYGNTDASRFYEIQVDFCNNGMWMYGCDVNIMTILDGSFTNNRRWGIYDNGFLGNRYDNCHFSFNGSTLQSNTVVQYKGNFYTAHHTDNLINVNKNPETSPDYWTKETSMQNTGVWDSLRTYVSGGAFGTFDLNARTTITGLYCEGFQPIPKFASATINIGGINDKTGGASISAAYRGITFEGLKAGQAVNVTGTRLVVNNTDKDTDAAGNFLIADTLNPTIILGGVSNLKGKTNSTSTLRYRSIDAANSTFLSTYEITYKNNEGVNALRIVPDPLVNNQSTIDFNYDKSIRIPLFAGVGERAIIADNTGKLVIGNSLNSTFWAKTDTAKAQNNLATFNDIEINKRWGVSGNNIFNLNSGNVDVIGKLSTTANVELRNAGFLVLNNFNNSSFGTISNFDDAGFAFNTGGFGRAFEVSNGGTPKFLKLATGLTPPITTGVTRPAIVDSEGKLSFNNSNYEIKPFDTYTSGAAFTIIQGETLFNPASVVGSLTITLPARPVDGQLIYLNFGGTIAAGAPVVSSLSFTGGTVYGIVPITVSGGDNFAFKYILSTNQWQRRKL